MGQSIDVTVAQVGNVAVFTTDRSVTGQDGVAFDSAEAAGASPGFPADLAGRIFGADDGIDHVYLASNLIMVRSAEAWTRPRLDEIAVVISSLFRHYSPVG